MAVMDKQDRQLIILLKQGDIKSYEILFHKYYATFYGFARGLAKGEWAAEDIAQNVFMKLWIHRSSLNEELSMYNYLFVLTKNEVFNYLRLKNNLYKYQSAVSRDAVVFDNLESVYDTNEIKRIVGETIDRMPPQRRKIYRMSRQEHFSNKEIAERLGLSVKTVEKHIELALRQIRENMPVFTFLLFLLFLQGM